MMDVILSRHAEQKMPCILANGLPDTTAIVVTPDMIGEGLAARFVDLKTIKALKTRFLKEVYPGVQVHAFGLEKLPPHSVLELSFSPSRSEKTDGGQDDELNLSYNFDVRLYPNPLSSPIPYAV